MKEKLRDSKLERAQIRDWSKSIGGGAEHLEMWFIKNT